MARIVLILVSMLGSSHYAMAVGQNSNGPLPCCNKAGGGCTDTNGYLLPKCSPAERRDSPIRAALITNSNAEGDTGDKANK